MESDKKSEEKKEIIQSSLITPSPILSLSEKLKLADNFRLITTKGSYLDCKDTCQAWCLAYVDRETESGELIIYYDGWDTFRFNEKLYPSSERLSPCRMKSRGFTGSDKAITPKRNITFNWQELNTMKANVLEIINTNFGWFRTAHQVTQFLRAKLYIYVDFLMTNTYIDPDNEIPKVVDFLTLVVKLLAEYFKFFSKHISSWIEYTSYQKLYLVDCNTALVAALPEMLDLLKTFFCQCERTFGFFVKYDVDVNQLQEDQKAIEYVSLPANKEFKSKRNKNYELKYLEQNHLRLKVPIIYGAQIIFFAAFCSAGGFDEILNITSPSYLKAEQIIDATNPSASYYSDFRLPLEQVLQFFSVFKNVISIASSNVSLQLWEALSRNFFNRIMMLNPRELKSGFNKEEIQKRMNSIEPIVSAKCDGDEIKISEIMDKIMLNIVIKQISCPSLDMKIKGLTDLKLFFDKLYNDPNINENKYYTREKLINWVISNNIVDQILDSDPHPELIRKLTPILQYVIKNNAGIARSIFEKLWKCQQNTHEDVVFAIYQALIDIVDVLAWENVLLLLEEIKAIDISKYDEKLLNFMREFTSVWFDAIDRKRTSFVSISTTPTFGARSEAVPMITEETPGFDEKKMGGIEQVPKKEADLREICLNGNQLLCVPIFWRLIQEETGFTKKEICLQALAECMKKNYTKPYLSTYITMCIENIKANRSVDYSIQLAKSLLKISPRKKTYPNEESVQDILCKLDAKFGLISTIIDSIQYFKSSSQKEEMITNEAGKAPRDKNHIRIKLQFFDYYFEYMYYSPIKVTFKKENLQRLWKIIMDPPFNPVEVRIFLDWLSNIQNLPNETNNYLGKDEDIFLFDLLSEHYEALSNNFAKSQLVNSPSYSKINLNLSLCFYKYFVLANVISGGMVSASNGQYFKSCNLEKLIGIEKLWNAAIKCEKIQARKEFARILVSTHTNIGKEIIEKRREIWKQFIDKCMAEFRRVSENEKMVVNVAELLMCFLEIIEGKNYKTDLNKITIGDAQNNRNNNDENTPLPLSILIEYIQDERKFIINIPENFKLGQLRAFLAQSLNLPYCNTMLQSNKTIIDLEEDEGILRDKQLAKNLQVQKISQHFSIRDVPLFILANNNEYISQLFEILKKYSCKKEVTEIIWKILQFIPINEKVLQDIQNLNILESPDQIRDKVLDTSSAWDTIFDSKSIHKLLYSLQIVDTLLPNNNQVIIESQCTEQQLKTQEISEMWKNNFCEKLGLNHIFKALLTLPTFNFHQQLDRDCFRLIMKIAIKVLINQSSIEKYIPIIANNNEKIIERLMEIIDGFIKYSLDLSNIDLVIGKAGEERKAENTNILPSQDDCAKTDIIDDEEAQKESNSNEAEAIDNAFRIIQWNGWPDKQGFIVEQIAKYKRFKEVIYEGLICTKNEVIKKVIVKNIESMCSGNWYLGSIKIFLPLLLTDLLKKVSNSGLKSRWYFTLCTNLIKNTSLSQIIQLEALVSADGIPLFKIKTILEILIDMTISHISFEEQEKDVDFFLIGSYGLIEAILTRFPEYKLYAAEYKNFLKTELIGGLITASSQPEESNAKLFSTGTHFPKCKSKKSRNAAFSLLCIISIDIKENLEQIVKAFVEYQQKGHFYVSNKWDISPSNKEKSITGYVGLKNPGCVCYMNSLLQQLFMIPAFRSIILSFTIPTTTNNEYSVILSELQKLFLLLSYSAKQAISTKNFCAAFKDYEGNPINIFEQMDVDEFFNLFMDRIEKAFSLNKVTYKKLSTLFEGQFSNKIICKDCPHRSESEEPFIAINLQIKNKRSLQQCLDSFVEGEEMQKSNAYHCDKCDKNVSALKKVSIKQLPQYLIFVLKRFSYDFDKGIKIKLNDYCEFPGIIDMAKYTENGSLGKEIYTLAGVIIHRGIADSGHYYSIIQDKSRVDFADEERWFEFNDSIVSHFEYRDMHKEAFGGEEVNKYGEHHEKTRSAYMLLYERAEIGLKESLSSTSSHQRSTSVSLLGSANKPTILGEKLTSIHTFGEVVKENAKYLHRKIGFSDEFFRFITNICNSWSAQRHINHLAPSKILLPDMLNNEQAQRYLTEKLVPIIKTTAEEKARAKLGVEAGEERKKAELMMFKLLCNSKELRKGVFFLGTVRSRSNNECLNQVDLLKSYINLNIDCAKFIICQFTHSTVINEFLLECNNIYSRRLIVGILYCAMIQVYNVQKGMILDYLKAPSAENILPNFYNAVLCHLSDSRWFHLTSGEYYQLIHNFTKLGSEMREYMMSSDSIRYLAACYRNDTHIEYDRAILSHSFPFCPFSNSDFALPTILSSEPRVPGKCCHYSSHQPNFQELILAFTNILRCCKIEEKSGIEKSIYALRPYNHPVDSTLMSQFASSSHIANLLIIIGQDGRVNTALSKALAHMAAGSFDFTKRVLNGYIQGLHEPEGNSLFLFFVPFYHLVIALEANFEQFIPESSKLLTNALFNHRSIIEGTQERAAHYQTSTFVLYVIENFIKAAAKSHVFLQFLQKSALLMESLIAFLDSIKAPPESRSEMSEWTLKKAEAENSIRKGEYDSSAKDLELGDFKNPHPGMTKNLGGIQITETNTNLQPHTQQQKEEIIKANKLLSYLKAISNSELIEYPNRDYEDFTEDRFLRGEQVQFFRDSKRDWCIGTVDRACDEVVAIRVDKQKRKEPIWMLTNCMSVYIYSPPENGENNPIDSDESSACDQQDE